MENTADEKESITPSTSGLSTPLPTGERLATMPDSSEPKRNPSHSSPDDLERQQSSASYYVSQHLSLPSEILFVSVICSAQLLTQIGFGQTLVPSQVIGDSLGATSPGQRSWTLAAFSLTVGTFVLPAGRLGDIYGSKKMVVMGWVWYALWTIIAGLAVFAPRGRGAVVMFSVCQALRGIGPAFLLPNALAIAGRSYPNGARKNMVFAAFAMCAPVGGVLGSVFGAIFAQLAWWPWIFWSTGIACAAFGVIAMMVIPADSKSMGGKHSAQTFDLVGSILGVSGLVLFNFAWNQAAVVGWATAYVPTLLAVGILVLVAFYFYERRISQPILPPAVFNLRSTAVLSVVAFGWASFGIFFYYTIAFLLNIRGLSLLLAAGQNSTVVPAGIIAAGITGISIKRVPAPWLMCIAGAAFMVGSVLVATMPADQTFWIQTFLAFVITPFGMDISFPASSLTLSDMVPKDVQGVAASLVNTVVNYSISIGLGIAGTAEMQQVQRGATELEGIHAAMYTGVGLATAAFLVGLGFAVAMQFSGKAANAEAGEKERGSEA